MCEGVETYDQWQALKAMGANVYQGYFFSKPVCSEAFSGFVEGFDIGRYELKPESALI